MGDRLSKSQIDKLGERLRDSPEVSEDDLALLQQVRAEHDNAMSTVADRLANELGLEPGTRLKTVGTIVDKLRREHMRLSQMQDIAGVRLVREMGLAEQDALVESVVGLFEGAKVTDRREHPSHGYRAVHVIVAVDGRHVEIQVRTELQHLWAQVFELVADRYGRAIRYGQPPDDPEALLVEEFTVRDFVDSLIRTSSAVALVENNDDVEIHQTLQELLREGVVIFSVGESES